MIGWLNIRTIMDSEVYNHNLKYDRKVNDHFAKNKDLYKIFYWKVYDLPRFFFQTEIIGSLGRKVYDH